ncbi:hypothetical protein FVEG_15121 [Fusarium verticillioides 7600]|uniref:Uncharacterized protein n=1 Tax=Gibberella moniliformis (strain M3125 / FGSC 7600) TaxID=334819 RepID=W7M5P4_GIBM7|nr:hypothetical protein FVEG_15121 [Fusarium verticillioides 7600]EWG40232.1 hypothetical protein FVEG_15121 [Fusarium verticillioides 7600]
MWLSRHLRRDRAINAASNTLRPVSCGQSPPSAAVPGPSPVSNSPDRLWTPSTRVSRLMLGNDMREPDRTLSFLYDIIYLLRRAMTARAYVCAMGYASIISQSVPGIIEAGPASSSNHFYS